MTTSQNSPTSQEFIRVTSCTSWPISSIVLKRLLKSMMTNGFHMGGKEALYGYDFPYKENIVSIEAL